MKEVSLMKNSSVTQFRKVSLTKQNFRKIVMSNDLNGRGTLFGGKLVAWIDEAAAITVRIHSRRHCVTAAIDGIVFQNSTYLCEIIEINTTVNRTWNTSAEVGVVVFALNPEENIRRYVVSAYLTFVALDDDMKPTPMPRVFPKTKVEKRRFNEANERRQARLLRREEKSRVSVRGV